MGDKKNVFISHVHEDDELIGKLKDLLSRSGMDVRNGSPNRDNPNNAKSIDYIRSKILAPSIRWASTLVVLISKGMRDSVHVDWEIEYAAKEGKRIVGVFAQGAGEEDVPKALQVLGDSVKAAETEKVGWNGDGIVKAIQGENDDFEGPEGKPLIPRTRIIRIGEC